jgi:hypothetical protein
MFKFAPLLLIVQFLALASHRVSASSCLQRPAERSTLLPSLEVPRNQGPIPQALKHSFVFLFFVKVISVMYVLK